MSVVIKILGMKPIQDLLMVLTHKLLGPGGKVKRKVAAGLNGAVLVMIVIAVAKYFDPGLGEILAGNEATLVAFVGVVSAIIAYYTKEEE